MPPSRGERAIQNHGVRTSRRASSAGATFPLGPEIHGKLVAAAGKPWAGLDEVLEPAAC